MFFIVLLSFSTLMHGHWFASPLCFFLLFVFSQRYLICRQWFISSKKHQDFFLPALHGIVLTASELCVGLLMYWIKTNMLRVTKLWQVCTKQGHKYVYIYRWDIVTKSNSAERVWLTEAVRGRTRADCPCNHSGMASIFWMIYELKV